jgi:hypothetical protein
VDADFGFDGRLILDPHILLEEDEYVFAGSIISPRLVPYKTINASKIVEGHTEMMSSIRTQQVQLGSTSNSDNDSMLMAS